MTFSLKVTATVAGVPVAVDVGAVVDVAVLVAIVVAMADLVELELGAGFDAPEPTMAMSAQVRYI